MKTQVVIVGAGAAGANAAKVLASAQDLEVVVVSEESGWPYNRTTVNKGFLGGDVDASAVELPGMQDLPVTWVRGQRAVALDPVGKRLLLTKGDVVDYQALLVACGSRARRLTVPIDDWIKPHVMTLRSLTDAQLLRSHLGWTDSAGPGIDARAPGSVVLVGGGLIGAETASVLHAGGAQVTIVDPSQHPLQRHVGSTVARWAHQAQFDAGVVARTGRTVVNIRDARDARPKPARGDADPQVPEERLRVTLSDGSRLAATTVVACMGVQPATRWLRYALEGNVTAGLPIDDEHRVPGYPGLYAAGECALVPGTECPVRAEHWGTALDQGAAAARTILRDLSADPTPPREVAGAARTPLPGFSTYLHGTKLTILGWPAQAACDLPVLGVPGDERFAVALIDREQRVVGGVGVGGARAVNSLRDLIQARAHASKLPDPT